MMKYAFLITIFCIASMAIEPIAPIPTTVAYDKEKALLGKRLFSEPLLSSDKSVSCESCHMLEAGGADPRRVSIGIKAQEGNVQSPTVFNSRFNFKQFWNGRADTLQEQAHQPVHNPVEMGADAELVEKRLNALSSYKKAFKRVYGTSKVRYEDVIDAIVEFENALVTPNAKFDRYLRKEMELTPLELKGYLTFKETGCITCHNGINIGGNSFQKIGLIKPYGHKTSYPDLYSLTHKEVHKNVFKVPTLRNIELTAPYFHDASASTLREAIETMAYHNLGLKFTPEEVEALVAFMKTLTGDKPKILELP